jgi:Sulfotransferase domain
MTSLAFNKAVYRTWRLHGGRSAAAAVVKRMIVDFPIVGFPKTGNTWYGALLRNVLVAHYGLPPETMKLLFVSDVGGSPSSILKIPKGIPRLYHSHCLPYPRQTGLSGMRESLAPFRHKPMVILFREAKDTLTSYYFHEAFRTRINRFTGSAEEFVRSPVYGIEKFVSYYNLLAETRLDSNAPTLTTHYEDLWRQPKTTLRKGLQFMGINNVSEGTLARAIGSCTIDNMRKMERVASQETALVPGLFKSHDDRPEALKARKGGIGNWRDCVTEELAAETDRYLAKNLNPLFLNQASSARETDVDYGAAVAAGDAAARISGSNP